MRNSVQYPQPSSFISTAAAPRRTEGRERLSAEVKGSWTRSSPDRRRGPVGAVCAAEGSAMARHEPLEDDREAEAAGVDHAGVAEDLELLGGPLHGGMAGAHGLLEHGDDVGALLGGARRRVGRLADDGEDGALGRLHHRLVGDGARLAEAARPRRGVEPGRAPDPLG